MLTVIPTTTLFMLSLSRMTPQLVRIEMERRLRRVAMALPPEGTTSGPSFLITI